MFALFIATYKHVVCVVILIQGETKAMLMYVCICVVERVLLLLVCVCFVLCKNGLFLDIMNVILHYNYNCLYTYVCKYMSEFLVVVVAVMCIRF